MQNELIHETSPYLRQHAHNPVHWQPWGEKALSLAKELNKPILVSIGYSACHWCHVMERESFEDADTAALMNEYFINIKIDREERPDLDHIYMDAVQAVSGSGGWPLNVFLTTDAKPFYGGTYFPPVRAFNRPSWKEVLENIHLAWTDRNEELTGQAETLTSHISNSNVIGKIKNTVALPGKEKKFDKIFCEKIIENLLKTADLQHGGFGKAPKFPQTFSINCLLSGAYFLKDERAVQHAELSLTKMFEGGIYDQLAGGLCRYSTDDVWLAPHFEKMLYDNALFIISASNAFLLTKKEIFKEAAVNTCNFLFAEMKDAAGGYYSALDADSEGEEGKFYLWTKEEVDEILGGDSALFCEQFDVTAKGNFEGKNILRKTLSAERNMSLTASPENILSAKEKLLSERNKRIRPATDDKIILAWNALLVTALAKAYAATGDEKFKAEAAKLFDFLESAFCESGENYFHTYKQGTAKFPAFADDYACLIDAAIHLREITGEEKYLNRAEQLTRFVIANFSDADSRYFFYTRKDQSDVIVRKIEIYDGAMPSANSVMAKNLLYLSFIFERAEWFSRAEAMIFSLKDIIAQYPGSFGNWAAQAMNIAAGFSEISISGPMMMPQLRKMLHTFLPNAILQSSAVKSEMPLLKERFQSGKTSLYLCRNQQCAAPVSDAEDLFQAISEKGFNF